MREPGADEWEDEEWTDVVATHFDPSPAQVEVVSPGVIFEKEEDRVEQREIMAALCGKFPWMQSTEMPPLHHFDFEVHDRSAEILFALMEMKRRHVPYRRYPNIWLSKAKADKCIAEAKERACNFYFVVGFDDGVRTCKMYDPLDGVLNCPVETHGRNGRVYENGKPVVESCYMIDARHFERT